MQSNTMKKKNSIINPLLLLFLLAQLMYAAGTSSQYHLRKRSLQSSGFIDCSDPSITLNDCRITPYCTVVEVPGQSLHVGGKCNSDHDCYPVVRSQSPSQRSSNVSLCDCYAGSTFDQSFDECEGQITSCMTAKCKNTCEGLRAFCPVDAPQLKFIALGPDANEAAYPLGECEGDCDSDEECEGSLVCFEREGGEVVPGCNGFDASATDYCVNPDYFSATYPTLTEVMGGKKFPTEEDRLATWDEKQKMQLYECEGEGICFDECEGVCCVTDECKSGECFWRNQTEGVPGCVGTGIVGANYCIHQRCALGYCVYKNVPPLEATGEVMLAYLFAQIRCCTAKLNWRDGYIQGFEGTAEEYCNMISFDIRNCPPEAEDISSEGGRAHTVCAYDEEGRCDLGDCYMISTVGRGDVYPSMWCCGASKSGPPLWWQSLRPNGNANQFCVEVGYDIRACD